MATASFQEFLKQAGGTAQDVQVVDSIQEQPEEVPFSSRVKQDITASAAGLSDALLGTGKYAGRSTLGRSFGATAEAFSAIPKVAMEILPKPARKGIEKVGEAVSGAVNLLADKVGDIQALQNWVTKHPDAAKNLEDIAGIGKSAGEISGSILAAEGLRAGAVGTGKLVKAGVQKAADVTSGIASSMKGKLTPDAASIMQRVARVSKGKQASFEQRAGEGIGTYLDKRGIYGNIENITKKLYERFSASKSTADNALSKLPGSYKTPPVETALKELLARETRVSTPGALSKDFSLVRTLFNKYQKEGLTMSEINSVKRLYERNIRLDFVKQNLPESVARATNLDNALRSWQVSQAQRLGLKNLPEINKETLLAKQLLDDLGKEYAGSAGNNAVTLTDWIVLSGGDPAAISAFIVKKGISSKEMQSWIAEKISKEKTKLQVPAAKIGTPKKEFRDLP